MERDTGRKKCREWVGTPLLSTQRSLDRWDPPRQRPGYLSEPDSRERPPFPCSLAGEAEAGAFCGEATLRTQRLPPVQVLIPAAPAASADSPARAFVPGSCSERKTTLTPAFYLESPVPVPAGLEPESPLAESTWAWDGSHNSGFSLRVQREDYAHLALRRSARRSRSNAYNVNNYTVTERPGNRERRYHPCRRLRL